MSEFNFDKMKNVDIPESWVEKTIIVTPHTAEKPFLFRRRMMFAFSCVSFLLVCVISLTVFLFVDKNDTPFTLSTEKNMLSEHISTENSFVTQGTIAENTKSEKTQIETEYEKIEIEEETEYIEENENETSDNQQTSSKVENNKKPDTDKNATNSNGVISGSSNGSSVSSRPSNNKPEYEENTQPPVEDFWMQHYFDTGLIDEYEPVYCKIYSVDEEKYLGNPDFTDEKYRAIIWITSNEHTYVRYYPVKEGLLTKNGEYIIYFCRQNGEVLCYLEYNVSIF